MAVSHINCISKQLSVRTSVQYAQSECHNTILKEWHYLEYLPFVSRHLESSALKNPLQSSQI